MDYNLALPGMCPHCGAAFTLPAGTLSMLQPGANLRCLSCKEQFWAWALPGAKAFSYANRFKRRMPAWSGPPLKGAAQMAHEPLFQMHHCRLCGWAFHTADALRQHRLDLHPKHGGAQVPPQISIDIPGEWPDGGRLWFVRNQPEHGAQFYLGITSANETASVAIPADKRATVAAALERMARQLRKEAS